MKKIAVLNDLSGMGKCSLTAAIQMCIRDREDILEESEAEGEAEK